MVATWSGSLSVSATQTGRRLRAAESQITVALLVEYSRASWPYFNDIVRAVEGFLNEAPGGNWYALATFSNTLW